MSNGFEIEGLRYVRLGVHDLSSACDFAERMLGLQNVVRDEARAWFRSDSRDYTLAFVGGSDEQVVGLEVRDMAALDAADTALRAADHATTRGDVACCEARAVKAYVAVASPGGTVVELVVRPRHSGWRYFPSRDTGVTGLSAVAVRAPDPNLEEQFWTVLLGGRVRDWAGGSAYIAFDSAHHRIVLHPSIRQGILAVEFGVEGIDQVMQANYFLPQAQVPITHGPGRRPTSGEIFLTFEGPAGINYSFVTEPWPVPPGHVPRQFAGGAGGYCSWGSDTSIEEFAAP